MSQTIGNLKRQIEGATDLQSVVRTMKAMAASEIVQFESSVRALADYSRTVELALSVCLRAADVKNLQQKPLPVGVQPRVAAIVFGSDQGLVGQFNTVICDEAIGALSSVPGEQMIWSVGERVHACLADTDSQLVGGFHVPSTVKAIAPLVGEILIEYERQTENHPATQLFVFHNRPKAGALYEPVSQRLLPLDETWRRQRSEMPWPTKNLPQVLGNDLQTMRKLTGEYLFVSMFRACAESLASENASRLAAMQRADKNIEELLETLTSSFHRQRQANIDEELFDVVSGFEALQR
ncbi:ATP synthase gamma chain, sodium ion specific [Roseimaritima multifibrata]|uniref:ATP synthase gamma chain, sodium ion specific n=1 Tax=Roseimaritima multifibrata TaxID=1930274 RepID=A0A517MHR8_9BACT|nr:F0F1 ATP synthase subunit gamma [Roseimaritima multifibrata]QDS94423.1 ATP synthase gamma chain, sodium ion specific [Roseimaritima multifibrata]